MTVFAGLFDNLVDTFSRQDITVTQRPAGSYVNGRYVAGTPAATTVQAAVYPATGDQMQMLPEARRSDETIVIYTVVEMYASTEGGQQADEVTYDSLTWEVVNVKRWATDGYEVMAAKVHT